MDTVAMQYCIGRPGVSSLSPGDQIYPSFSGYSSSVREKKSDQCHFSTGGVILDGGVDRLYTKSFSFLVGLSLSLIDAGAVVDPPGSTTRMGLGCSRVRPDTIST